MDLELLQKSYNKRYRSVEKRVSHCIDELDENINELSLEEMKIVIDTILEIETKTLHDEVEKLLSQKEQIERKLEHKSQDLQVSKYSVFDAIEAQLTNQEDAISKLYQLKLQTIDLFDILSEITESAIITSMEKDKDSDIDDTIQEVIKDITYEAIKEGPLNTIRIRKILSTILQAAIDVAEASPVKAREILTPTLKGMRSGLIHSINRFKQRLAYIPIEAKNILIEDYDTIIEDLNQTDSLFSQVINTQANESSLTIKDVLLDINKSMRYDLEELLLISKEAAEIMRGRFSNFAKEAVKKADSALKSPKATEAKRIGKQAFSVARNALESAIKSAKDVIDSKK